MNKYRVKHYLEVAGGIIVAILFGLGVFGYVMYLQDHGCVIGTTCISVTR